MRRIEARVESFEIGLHEAAAVMLAWVVGLSQAGLLGQADQVARRYRERCQDTPGPAEVLTSSMCAYVAMFRGQVKTAARWHRQAIAALHNVDSSGWLFAGLVGLARALGMAGDATSARQALVDMTAARHPVYVYLEPNVLLAKAWVAAAEGSLSEALALARQAAEIAAAQHQPAVEVFALQTAVCFGDRTVADRLRQLATQVDGPRAGAAAAHATALAAITTPLPLTQREREIVITLAASGLSNREIVLRLVVSVRTVENHLYRACTKLGASDRAELAALLRGH